jgi:hypothetical protein
MSSKTSTRNGSTASLVSDNGSLCSSIPGEHTPPASEAGITTSMNHGFLDTALTCTTDNEPSNDVNGDGPILSHYGESKRAERDFDAHAHLAVDQHANNGSNHKTLGPPGILLSELNIQPGAASEVPRDDPPEYAQKAPTGLPGKGRVPPLNVVMHVVGLHSEIQPFVALGNVLKTYGHRVRLATHPYFKSHVEENGLEFFSVGGDPAELAEIMAKDAGRMLSILSFGMSNDTSKLRTAVQEIIHNCWKSCIEPSEQPVAVAGTTGSMAGSFVADVIIANPPSLAHIHCAEKLGIPLHLMSTWVYFLSD